MFYAPEIGSTYFERWDGKIPTVPLGQHILGKHCAMVGRPRTRFKGRPTSDVYWSYRSRFNSCLLFAHALAQLIDERRPVWSWYTPPPLRIVCNYKSMAVLILKFQPWESQL